MAEAADNFHPDFDWQRAEEELLFAKLEAQLSNVSELARRPENEQYGRSLSTIYRFGAYIVEKVKEAAKSIGSPEAAQAKVEFETSVKEGFGTDVELSGGLEVRDIDRRSVINGKVMAKNLKTAISDMTRGGLRCAIEEARKDRRFLPQLTRTEWDHQNALAVDRMARGETAYNMRIIVSPFPEEAAAQSGEDYWRHIGYVPHLKRGFLQLYYVTEDGGLLAGSLSFDGCDKKSLREILGRYGVTIPEDEITDNYLNYAITDTLSEVDAVALALEIADEASVRKREKSTNTVDVTSQHQAVMDRVFNESYVHLCESLARGYQTTGIKDLIRQLANQAQHFNEHYANALYRMRADGSTFSDEDSIILHELLVYSTIEMMRAFHLKDAAEYGSNAQTYTDFMNMEAALFQDMLSGFGAAGAKSNRSYSACGLAISAGQENPDNSPQSAYGGVDSEEDKSKKKVMSCPFCSAKVFDDPCAKVLSCWDCRARVVNGKVEYKGDGGSKARQARKAAEVASKAEEASPAEEDLAAQVDAVFEERNLSMPEQGKHTEEKQQTTVSKQIGQLALAP